MKAAAVVERTSATLSAIRSGPSTTDGYAPGFFQDNLNLKKSKEKKRAIQTNPFPLMAFNGVAPSRVKCQMSTESLTFCFISPLWSVKSEWKEEKKNNTNNKKLFHKTSAGAQ